MATTLFKGTQASGTIIAVQVPIIAGCIGVHVEFDSVAAATIAVQLTGFEVPDEVTLHSGGAGTLLAGEGIAVIAAADLQKWPDSGLVVEPVVAGAAGARLIQATNLRMRMARLFITSSAICIWGIKHGIMDV
jgi:hypothetical protein